LTTDPGRAFTSPRLDRLIGGHPVLQTIRLTTGSPGADTPPRSVCAPSGTPDVWAAPGEIEIWAPPGSAEWAAKAGADMTPVIAQAAKARAANLSL
jgi:hypothetical protein